MAAGAEITAYDPAAIANVKSEIGGKINYTESQYKVLENADALLIATEWSAFRSPDFDKVSSLLKEKVIFDGRNLYDLESMRNLNYHYESVGRKTVKSV